MVCCCTVSMVYSVQIVCVVDSLVRKWSVSRRRYQPQQVERKSTRRKVGTAQHSHEPPWSNGLLEFLSQERSMDVDGELLSHRDVLDVMFSMFYAMVASRWEILIALLRCFVASCYHCLLVSLQTIIFCCLQLTGTQSFAWLQRYSRNGAVSFFLNKGKPCSAKY